MVVVFELPNSVTDFIQFRGKNAPLIFIESAIFTKFTRQPANSTPLLLEFLCFSTG